MAANVDWPSQVGSRSGGYGARADGRQNRRRLLAAAGEHLAEGSEFTLADAAARAGVSTATAYRHFRSSEDLTNAFVAGFWDDADSRAGADEHAASSLSGLCELWVGAVLDWGPALVAVRSREGLLSRRARGDGRVARLLRIAEPALRAELDRSGEDPARLDYVLAVWNALADPREILDQHEMLGWPAATIAAALRSTVECAIEAGAGSKR
ncbi:TetR/AcrR family transcriptional regulator [Thermoleophilia bacterium SCSIO 60948]|nr:TetR/AcrR family transcriptional regulator [Thermoleophilia bacterium SCSIO 60948]